MIIDYDDEAKGKNVVLAQNKEKSMNSKIGKI